MATPASLCVVGYSLFVLLLELLLPVSVLVDLLFSVSFGFLVFPGIVVDDLARLSVT
jgi:hypothetical protein